MAGVFLEGLLFLVLSLVGLAVFAAPIFSIVSFLRGRAMRARLDELSSELEALRGQVIALQKRVAGAERVAPTPTSPPPPVPPMASTARPIPPLPVAPVPTFETKRPPSRPAASVGSGPAGPEPIGAPEPPLDLASAPGFDWESMLGVRGAAWLGGVTLVIAALFFAKWSIDQGFFSPVIRFGTMLLVGTTALVWAELKLREEYQTTANAVSGTGVVILYAAFFAGHSLYQLFSLTVAFVGMSIVTLLAAVIAIRFAALFTAVIGLAGGFATPVLLSSGVDRPLAFFSYLSVLTAGFLYVAERRTWATITALALAGTSTLQLGWYASWMAPEKFLVGTAAFAVLGGIYLWHAVRLDDAERQLMHQAALTGALVPLGFAVLLATEPRFAPQWVGLIAFLTVLDAALVVVALVWRVPLLVGASALATGLVVTLLGDTAGAVPSASWGLPIAAIALTVCYNLLPRLASRWDAAGLSAFERLPLLVYAATGGGLLGFAWLAIDGGNLELWAFVVVISTALAVSVERTRGDSWPGVFAVAALAIAWTCRHWVIAISEAATYADHLTLPHLVATAIAIVASWRSLGTGHTRSEPLKWWQTDHAATVAAAGVAYLTALTGLTSGAGVGPAPLFALVGLDLVLMLAVAVQAGWPALVPLAAVMSLAFNAAWHIGYFGRGYAVPAAAAYTATYLVFLVWPFAAARWLSSSWKTRPAPWLVSALVGPATFPLYHALWREVWGTALIGVVPVVMAAVSVAALYGIARYFLMSGDAAESGRRLNYLALFATVTLGFIATAVPLQLDRQWITIGWALEAAAVWWLFGLLPHPGLKYFGLGLFLAVGVRLLLNDEVLRYEPRGGPILNWLLYTYGVPAICCFAGAYFLRQAERRRGPAPEFDVLARDRDTPGSLVGFIGLLLVFWLINLEIADYYSVGRYVEVDLSRHLARDLTRSCAWGLFALILLGLGLWRVHRSLRLVSLGFLLLTVAKVFLYDLGQLTGLYRIISFLALGVSLILVSLLYQRFVRKSEAVA